MSKRIFGHIPGYPEGSHFESRQALSKVGVHRPTQAGISGSEKEGADSIVLSGGYEDDLDLGDVIVYTGHWGRDPRTGQQDSDQVLRYGNMALARSKMLGLPVRVIRGYRHDSPYAPETDYLEHQEWSPHVGYRHDSPYAPETGYRYDGLYHVEDYWRDRGRSGFIIWRFRLVAAEARVLDARKVAEEAEGYEAAPRQETTLLRIVRDTPQARRLKELYDYRCQVCDTRLEGSAGPYAEAAHIRPLGEPHNGPDTPDNLLCLCPNHHVLFDYGAFSIADDYTLVGLPGNLYVDARHQINLEHVRYHREHYYRAI